ncbi:MAG: HlyD family efflux transporter periplasmic adaptor subunit [Rubrivivax sp.]
MTALVAVCGIAYGAYWALVLNHYESTDNAYVQGNVVQVTPQLGGTVTAIKVDDTDHVKAGQLLVTLDPADAQVGVEQAEAQLAQTTREVRTLYANNSTLQAQIALRTADLAKAESELVRAQSDVDRRAPLVAGGAVGKEEFEHVKSQLTAVRSSVAAARSAVQAAREQLASNEVLTQGTAVEQHPNVLRAAARVREATLALSRVELRSPVDGYIARRNVQLGQRVAAGAPLMSVVALDTVWIEANFKESQLQNLRIGQPVEAVADVYGKSVTYRGNVEGLGAGTGAAFALLPAQNATGNWIKVVQRVPVRVALDPAELAKHPLRVGLSMDVRVDIHNTDGRVLALSSEPEPVPETAPAAAPSTTAAVERARVDARVRRIVAANGGGGSRAQSGDRALPSDTSRRAAQAVAAGKAGSAGAVSVAAQ